MAAESAEPRYIIFRVGGIVELESTVNIKGNVTIAGQTAPGGGIMFRNYPFKVSRSR